MVNTDFTHQDDTDDDAPYRTFGLGLNGRLETRLSIRRVHR